MKPLFDNWLYPTAAIPSERLVLRSVRMSDAEDLFETCRDPRVSRYVLWETHRDIRRTKEYIRFLHRSGREGGAPTYAIELREQHKVIGTISFLWIDKENRSTEVGYSLNYDYWGRGYATEALKTVLGYAFDTWNLNRIEAQHDVENPASGRVMEKAGMKREGVLRQRIFNKGHFIDVALYSVLRKEFKP